MHGTERTQAMEHGMEKNRECDWITVAEMRRYMGVGRTKAYELVHKGEIRSYRIGKKILVSRQSVDRFIRANGSF